MERAALERDSRGIQGLSPYLSELRVKNRLVVLLAGLSLGVLAACGVTQPPPAGEPDGGGSASCGDGLCKGGETCGSCSADCGSCPPPSPYCGDDLCNGDETGESCLRDCHASGPVLGRFARYCGKVNSHTSPDGTWTWDQDCTSGCKSGDLAYCQKFWPSTISIRRVPVSSKPNNVWANAECAPVTDDFDGGDEFECVAMGTVVGRFARYCGKVNSHTLQDGTWTWDQDCMSGCNVGDLAYCQKFWPSATIIRQVSVTSKPNNVWANAGCEPVNDDYDGGDEFVCMK
jgi:hypothetical protein